jgi:cyclophilin family peptidyl-prolyl cis-trans isomerase
MFSMANAGPNSGGSQFFVNTVCRMSFSDLISFLTLPLSELMTPIHAGPQLLFGLVRLNGFGPVVSSNYFETGYSFAGSTLRMPNLQLADSLDPHHHSSKTHPGAPNFLKQPLIF